MKSILVQLTDEEYELLVSDATDQGHTPEEVVNFMIQGYVDAERLYRSSPEYVQHLFNQKKKAENHEEKHSD